MDLYGQHSKSIPQKLTIHILAVLLLWLSYWILFQHGGTWIEDTFHLHNASGYTERRIAIFTFSVITLLRFSYMMIVLLKRAIPWKESFSVPFAFALYFVGFALFVLPTSKRIDVIDVLAVLIFVLGSVLNTGGEILRNEWKKNPDNKGRIYTEGFFRYSRHVNYFGDLLWVIAYAILTRNWYAASIPVLLFCLFAFYNAPKLDTYLQSKYGSEYDEYASKTKMLIPFIY